MTPEEIANARAVRRTAIMLGLVALAFYVGVHRHVGERSLTRERRPNNAS